MPKQMRFPCFVILALFLIIFGTSIIAAGTASDQNVSGQAIPPVQEEGGRTLERSDWIAHLPLACDALLLVIVVDVIFIIKIRRDRRAGFAVWPATGRK